MSYAGWVALVTVAAVVLGLATTRRRPSVLLLAGVILLMTLGVISEHDALAGLSNPGLAIIAVLFGVAAGLRETGAVHWVAGPLLGNPGTVRGAQVRVMVPVATLSAFMNNTPLVAVMMPVVHDWARQRGLSVSRLLLPLSYASILGGACTLIGTSTILVVNGLLIADAGRPGLGLFDIAWVGVPCALAGLAYLTAAAAALLPDRRPAVSREDDARRYTVEMIVERGGPLAGRSIEEAGLRHLPGLYLIEIEREGQPLAAVSSAVTLREDDRLVFVGVVASVVDLQRIRGLVPATSQVFKLDEPRSNRLLVEAVVSDTCPLVGQTIRAGRFRTRYNAAVIALGRAGERVGGKIGDIELRAGDLLLLEARAAFADQHRNSRDFYLVSRIEGSEPTRHERAGIALGILGAMVLAVATGSLGMLNASLLALGAMVLTRCCSVSAVLRGMDWEVLLVIAGALGLGRALETSGAAHALAGGLLALAGDSPMLTLAVVCGATMAFTNVINAKAAAALMFPVAMEAATRLGIDLLPLAVGIMIGAAFSFATPIGYQTNLMVMGPGGYRFGDYAKVGLPLSVLTWVLAVLLIPLSWPF